MVEELLDTKPIVRVSNVSKIYGFTHALKKVDLQIEKGETVGLLGNNGAGKSTLLKIIALLVKPTAGKVEMFGKEVKEDQHLLKKNIGTLLSHSFFYEDMTGRENLEFYLKMTGRTAEPAEVVEKAVKKYNLRFYIDRPAHELSTGMAKKLEILRVALPNFPKLLLLDEPFSGLDVENRRFLNQLITERDRDITVVICSHDFNAIAQLCTRVFYLEKGGITKVLTPPEYDFFLKK
ncbi:MAG: ABC transporter ATP-binding protein [Candidatus Odinarchaeota archaeon]